MTGQWLRRASWLVAPLVGAALFALLERAVVYRIGLPLLDNLAGAAAILGAAVGLWVCFLLFPPAESEPLGTTERIWPRWLPESGRAREARLRFERTQQLLDGTLPAALGHPRCLSLPLPLDRLPARAERMVWATYLAARAGFDSGELALVVAGRRLTIAERRQALGQGLRYPNTFILLEPRDDSLPLPVVEVAGWPALGRAQREAQLRRWLGERYGLWLRWFRSIHSLDAELERIDWRVDRETLAQALRRALEAVYPPAAFEAALLELLDDRSGWPLSGASVREAALPFRTRLGLPVLYEEALIQRAVRVLVNRGSLRVGRWQTGRPEYQGPERPIPPGLSDDELLDLTIWRPVRVVPQPPG